MRAPGGPYPAPSAQALGWLRYMYRKIHIEDDWSKEGRPSEAWDAKTGPPTLNWHRFDLTFASTTPDGRPAQVAFRFRAALESDEYRWLQWGKSGAAQFRLPSVGERVEIPRAVRMLGAAWRSPRAP